MNAICKAVKLAGLSFAVAMAASAPVLAATGPANSKNPPTIAIKEKAEAGSGSSYAACYFKLADGNVKYYWGLSADNSWYSFSGDWIKTPHTKLEKFAAASDVTDENLKAACQRSKEYYKVNGDMLAIFAAAKSGGYNYPILLGDRELYPRY